MVTETASIATWISPFGRFTNAKSTGKHGGNPFGDGQLHAMAPRAGEERGRCRGAFCKRMASA